MSLKPAPDQQEKWKRRAAAMRAEIEKKEELTARDLIVRGWRDVNGRWFKDGAMICNRGRGPAGATFEDAVKIEAVMDEWEKQTNQPEPTKYGDNS